MRNKEEAIYYLAKRLWKHTDKKPILFFYSITFVLSNLVLLLYPLLIAKIVNIIQLEGVSQDNIYRILAWISCYFVLELAFWGLHGPARYFETINAFKVKANYKMYLLDGVMKLPSSWHASHQSGNTIDKIEKGCNALYDFSEGGFMIIATVVKLIGATAILFFFNVPSGLIVASVIVFAIFVIIKLDKPLIKNFHILNKFDNQISAKVYDTVSNITTVIILRLQRMLSKSLLSKVMHPLPLFEKNVKQKEIKWFIVSMMATLMIAATLGTYIVTHLVRGEMLLIGSMMAIFQYTSTIENIFYHFCYRYGEIVKKKTDVENSEILCYDFEKLQDEKIKQINLSSTGWKELLVGKLDFKYKAHGEEIDLKNLPHSLKIDEFVIKKGEKIALIGESGAGKTTFLKVIRDLYTPQKIDLKVDDLKVDGFKQLSNSISLIPQDPEIFAGTIKENITFGIRKTAKEIKKYTDLAMFTKVIPSLPNGLDSKINERGVNLSGGQKQRLALARGLLASSDKEIILLDEPTSSVDPLNEVAIYKNVFQSFKKKTILSSVHRLNLLPLFDRIFIFDNGKIVEMGTFSELKRKSKRFSSLWKKYKSEK